MIKYNINDVVAHDDENNDIKIKKIGKEGCEYRIFFDNNKETLTQGGKFFFPTIYENRPFIVVDVETIGVDDFVDIMEIKFSEGEPDEMGFYHDEYRLDLNISVSQHPDPNKLKLGLYAPKDGVWWNVLNGTESIDVPKTNPFDGIPAKCFYVGNITQAEDFYLM